MPDNDPQARLDAYLDGELPADERANLERRLTESSALTDELAALRRLGAALRDAAEPPARMTELQLARLHQTVDRQREAVVLRTAQFAAAIAAAILLACSISFIVTNRTPAEDYTAVASDPVSLEPGLTYVLAPDEGPAGGAALALMGGDAAGQEAQIAQWVLRGLEERGRDE